jgi:hypothetical protein
MDKRIVARGKVAPPGAALPTILLRDLPSHCPRPSSKAAYVPNDATWWRMPRWLVVTAPSMWLLVAKAGWAQPVDPELESKPPDEESTESPSSTKQSGPVPGRNDRRCVRIRARTARKRR